MRRRKLPADVVVGLVIAVCLLAHRSFGVVVRTMGITAPTRRGHAQAPPSTGAIADARKRVGSDAMCELFRISAQHWVKAEDVSHLNFGGLQAVAVDGFTARIADTPTNNQEFGKPSSRRDDAAYPQVRAVCVFDVATHVIMDGVFGPYSDAEVPLLEEAIPRLPDASVSIFDSGFNSYGSLYRIQSHGVDRHWLVRAKSTLAATSVRALGPGDTRVRLAVSPRARKLDPTLPKSFEARRIDYVIAGKDYSLLTSLLDVVRFPADQVAALYHSRWEAELVIDDVKIGTEHRAGHGRRSGRRVRAARRFGALRFCG